FGYFFVSAFRTDDEALSTYGEELMVAQSLEEAVQRKLASGRGYLLAHDEQSRRAFEQADSEIDDRLRTLQARVKSEEGTSLIAAMAAAIDAHDRAVRQAMAAGGTVAEIARSWTADVYPLAAT